MGLGKLSVTVLPAMRRVRAKLRIMSWVVVFGAVAGRLATAAGYGGDGTGSQIAQAEELLQELGSLRFQSSQIIRHRDLLSVSHLVCKYIDAQNDGIKKGKPLDRPFLVVHPRARVYLHCVAACD